MTRREAERKRKGSKRKRDTDRGVQDKVRELDQVVQRREINYTVGWIWHTSCELMRGASSYNHLAEV